MHWSLRSPVRNTLNYRSLCSSEHKLQNFLIPYVKWVINTSGSTGSTCQWPPRNFALFAKTLIYSRQYNAVPFKEQMLPASQPCRLFFASHFFLQSYTGSPPNCATFYCKPRHCIMDRVPYVHLLKSVRLDKFFHMMAGILLRHTKRHMTFVLRALCT